MFGLGSRSGLLPVLLLLFSCTAASLAAQNSGTTEISGSEPNTDSGQSIEVGIYPIVVEEGEREPEILQNLGTTVRDTLTVTLKFMRGYRVFEVEDAGPPTPSGLSDYAELYDLDNIIFGTIRDAEGLIEVELSVYDRFENEITEPMQARAESVFEIFDTADRLVAELVEAFSGVRVAYGRLIFNVHGPDDPYRVLIDGMTAGERIRNFNKLMVGQHDIRVVQQRRGDTVDILTERSIHVREAETYEFDLHLEGIREDEKAVLHQLDRKLFGSFFNIPEGDLSFGDYVVHDTLTHKLEWIQDMQNRGFTRYGRIARKYRNWHRAFRLFHWGEETLGRSFEGGPLRAAQNTLAGPQFDSRNTQFSSVYRVPDRKPAETGGVGSAGNEAPENSERFFEFTELYRNAVQRGLPRRRIEVDGDFSDWDNLNVVSFDNEPVTRTGLSAVKAAQNDRMLYFAIPLTQGTDNAVRSDIVLENDETHVRISASLLDEGSENYFSGARVFVQETESDSGSLMEIGDVTVSEEGYEVGVPLEELTAHIGDQVLSVYVRLLGKSGAEHTEPEQVFICAGPSVEGIDG